MGLIVVALAILTVREVRQGRKVATQPVARAVSPGAAQGAQGNETEPQTTARSGI
jgi:hypothetical protein